MVQCPSSDKPEPDRSALILPSLPIRAPFYFKQQGKSKQGSEVTSGNRTQGLPHKSRRSDPSVLILSPSDVDFYLAKQTTNGLKLELGLQYELCCMSNHPNILSAVVAVACYVSKINSVHTNIGKGDRDFFVVGIYRRQTNIIHTQENIAEPCFYYCYFKSNNSVYNFVYQT